MTPRRTRGGSFDDVDATTAKAVAAGGKEMLAPMDFPGGRMAMVVDPQGAIFGLLRLAHV